MRFARVFCLLWLALLPPPVMAAGDATAPELTVFAAASLQESLDAVAADWTRRSGQPVRVSYAGSSALARQIEQGAPADVFVSADRDWMDYLQSRGGIDAASRFDLVGNDLVLVAPAGDAPPSVDLTAAALATALGPHGRLAVAETGAVPAGRYARQALEHLGLWESVSDRLAQADNVRAALAFVARGEAPLGIVYATDARAEPGVVVVATFPAASHAPIIYPAARVAAADAERSRGFLAFLRGDAAAARFAEAGFRRP